MELSALSRWSSFTARSGPVSVERLQRLKRLRTPAARDKAAELKMKIVRRFGKGFAIGFAGKAILAALAGLIRAKGNLRQFVGSVMGSTKIWRSAARHGAFLGGFLAIFETMVRRLSQSQIGKLRVLRAPIAALAASPSLLFLPRDTRAAVALFFGVRSLEILGIYLTMAQVLPEISFIDLIVMVAATGRILWAWLKLPDSLDLGYIRFLDKQGGFTVAGTQALRGILHGIDQDQDLFKLTDARQLWTFLDARSKNGLPPLPFDKMRCKSTDEAICEILHPETPSCFLHFLKFVLQQGIPQALPVYFPVYVIPAIIFRHRQLFSRPLQIVIQILSGMTRSSLFLAIFCGLGWYSSCISRRNLRIGQFGLAGLAGVAVLIEKKSRRIELALYILAHAIRSILYESVVKRWIHPIPLASLLSFAVAMTIVMTSFVEKPEILRPSYRSLLGYFFGSASRTMGIKNPDHAREDELLASSMSIPQLKKAFTSPDQGEIKSE